MATENKETTTKRLSVTPTTFDRVRDFARGMDASYDEVIEALLGLVEGADKDPLLAGRMFKLNMKDKLGKK